MVKSILDSKHLGELIVGGCLVPGFPHPLLAPQANEGWDRLRRAYARLRVWLEEVGTERLVVFSTGWPSVIGHQVQASSCAEWVHVDPEFHSLGSIPYAFSFDPDFAENWTKAAIERGLSARSISYKGFPIDTGSVVLLKLINADQRFKVNIISCNVYADRAETVALGKATRDAIEALGDRTAVVSISALSARQHQHRVLPSADQISFPKDDEWNKKIVELLARGRLEDVSQLSRQIAREANLDQKGRAIWWLSAALGNTNAFEGSVFAYEPLCGTGATIAALKCISGSALGEQEFDEDEVSFFRKDRDVLSVSGDKNHQDLDLGALPRAPLDANSCHPHPEPPRNGGAVVSTGSPRPVGAYPHARVEGEWVFLSGIGPRHPTTGQVQGGPIRDPRGNPLNYDAAEQTRAVIENIKQVLASVGGSLSDIVDVTCYLVNMERDFSAFNAVYAEHFSSVQACRATVAVTALPTPIAVEFKVIARNPSAKGKTHAK
jgi:2-aminophenol/2-amino-5-chlorophenol 1,6-dioxygenase alpha subunit